MKKVSAFNLHLGNVAWAKFEKKQKKITRKEKDDIYKSLGLKKVRGALGGIYYE